jgi:hypothetical protein
MHGLGYNPISNILAENTLGCDINPDAQLSLEIHKKAAEIHECPITVQIYQ